MGKRNPVAKLLRTVVYRPRRTKAAKGKGAYTRNQRHRSTRSDGVFFLCLFACHRPTFRNYLPLDILHKARRFLIGAV